MVTGRAPYQFHPPLKKGFDFFFGYNCQRQAHTYYPVHLYKNEKRVYLDNDTIAPNTKLSKGADPNNPASYVDYTLNDYAPKLMFDEMMGFVSRNKDRPFFFYWATPIPHNPIQAPQRWVDHYIKKFSEEKPYLGEKDYFPHKNPRAGYAAMISYLDENVGKLVKYLKDEGLYDNTLIIFTSDNGVTFTGGTDGTFFNSSGPFGEERGKGKGFVYEGGIRVPMIATWRGHIESRQQNRPHIGTVRRYGDLGVPDRIGKAQKYPRHQLFATLLGKGDQKEHDFLYWEFPEYGGQVALRMGDWKLVRQHLKDEQEPTLELYNLNEDPTESNNVALKHPEIVQRAAAISLKKNTKMPNGNGLGSP